MLSRALRLNAYAVASQGAILAGGILFAVILTRLLTTEDYGLVSSFISFVVFITLVSDMGIRTTASKFVGAAFFSKDPKLWKYIVQFGCLRFLFVLIMGLATFALSGNLAESILHSQKYTYIFQFTGITAIIYSAMHFLEGLVSAANKYEYTFAGSVIVNASRLVLPVAAVLFIAPTAEWTITGVATGYLLGALSYVFFFHRTYGMKLARPEKMGKEVRTFAVYAGVLALAGAFLSNFDTVLLNAFLSPESVALYKAAQIVLIGVISLAPISYMVIFTFFVELEAGGNRKAQSEAYSQATRYGLIFFLPISVMMFVLSADIIGFLYPGTYLPAADALKVFAFIPPFVFLFNMNIASLQARGEIREACKLVLLAGGASIVLNVLLIPYFGFVGAAMAYAVAYILPTLLSFPTMARKLELHVKWTALARPVAISVLAAGAVAAARLLGLSNEIALIAVFPLACAALYLLTLEPEDRRLLDALLSLVRSEKDVIRGKGKGRGG
ncbi:MAG: oligosaccharide flippase family protein [Candidatus Burarchaeum sp.]|nr:oligosaccharide flippase family protein [Candidatus Burarchaeum sp.]MDO8339039.1 oligosaccharide flippase family protein [Candidatus Burarchaeum sp.]